MALTHDQVRQLAEASGEVSTMVYTLAYTGIRYGEAAALRVGDVDTTRRRLTVSRSITRVRKIGLVEGGTKTHAGPDGAYPRVRCRRAGRCDQGPRPARVSVPRSRWRADDDWMVPRQVRQGRCEGGAENVSPHSLRHTAGSLALASGASVVTVQKLLGHRNATTTMNVYSHMLPDDFDNLAAAMDKAARATR